MVNFVVGKFVRDTKSNQVFEAISVERHEVSFDYSTKHSVSVVLKSWEPYKIVTRRFTVMEDNFLQINSAYIETDRPFIWHNPNHKFGWLINMKNRILANFRK